MLRVIRVQWKRCLTLHPSFDYKLSIFYFCRHNHRIESITSAMPRSTLTLYWNSTLKKYYICVYVYVCSCTCVHDKCVQVPVGSRATTNAQRSEENIMRLVLVLSLYLSVDSRLNLGWLSLHGKFFCPTMSHLSGLMLRIPKPVCDLITWKSGMVKLIH